MHLLLPLILYYARALNDSIHFLFSLCILNLIFQTLCKEIPCKYQNSKSRPLGIWEANVNFFFFLIFNMCIVSWVIKSILKINPLFSRYMVVEKGSYELWMLSLKELPFGKLRLFDFCKHKVESLAPCFFTH